ncbi:uncharacterized protein TRUGW13939_06926 [Talaromyces rugulosus]|uniref:Myb-like domain-containing protein n=1 Tax=Talaromyces rugulosus TaxID=121627 RepID=A0A7H8R065_TALRU|nr:uncharacterized protein TRUGW13939_06926 [Talaromyces rugulosus]QKX59784.1 hypothetical protein TRUGW13939_06926 [Talaromyces rugulosus]
MSTNENDSGIDQDYDYIFGPFQNAAAHYSSDSWRGSSPDLPQGDKNDEVAPEHAQAAVEEGGKEYQEQEKEDHQVGEEEEEEEESVEGEEWIDESSEDEAGRERYYQGSRQAILSKSVLRQNQRQCLTKECVKAYQTLLNDMHVDADYEPNTPEEELSLVTTKVGLTQWTKREEDNFFIALARKGKNSVEKITQHVQSKSQLEVQEYISLLQNAVQETGEENQDELIRSFDIPAAVEISEETDEVLDHLAEHVSILDQRTKSIEGREKHGRDTWLIDSKTASRIDDGDEPDKPDALKPGISSVAELFDLTEWVRLSRKIFMNSGTSRFEDNWRNLAFKDESPSLTADAFTDLHDHAMSITRHLVEISLLFAQDRLARVLHVEHERQVKKSDVLKALSALNMKPNAFHHFIGVARRLQLDVADISNKRGRNNRYLSYDEVEKVLSRKRRHGSARSRRGSVSRGRTSGKSERNFDEDDDLYLSPHLSESEMAEGEGSDEEVLSVLDDDDQFHSSIEDINQSRIHAAEHEASDDDHCRTEAEAETEIERHIDEYTEFIDQEASKDDELALRQLLQCPEIDDLPPIVKAEQDEAPPMPEVESKKRHNDDVDWKDGLVYQAEWEAFGPNLQQVDEAIAKNHKKRRLE